MSRLRIQKYQQQNITLCSLLAVAQLVMGSRVAWRLLRSAGGVRLSPEQTSSTIDASISIIVPVLNEYHRLAPCLEGLCDLGNEIGEIIIVDGGSVDGTQDLIAIYAQREPRLRLVNAQPIPDGWNGKAWGLHIGLQAVQPDVQWILTIDADVRPRLRLPVTMMRQAQREQLAALSIATSQEIESVGEGLLHPSLLTTLVYRFGIPGKPPRHLHEVQANGQCFLFRRDALTALGGFYSVRHSLCEDVTIARMLMHTGYRIAFYEADHLVTVHMYNGWREMWQNWTRSLPMHDQYSGIHTLIGWLEIALVQALPLPLLLVLLLLRRRCRWLLGLNGILTTMRIGVLFGTARTYQRRPWSYWLSPVCDVPVTIQLARKALQRKHSWRGRTIIRQR
ncbi:MAG TPA: glycosyltransferase family 2 protein [Ktedonobacteraceae bacterium]|jgi:dolichol-phosphate mannosyltransferase